MWFFGALDRFMQQGYYEMLLERGMVTVEGCDHILLPVKDEKGVTCSTSIAMDNANPPLPNPL